MRTRATTGLHTQDQAGDGKRDLGAAEVDGQGGTREGVEEVGAAGGELGSVRQSWRRIVWDGTEEMRGSQEDRRRWRWVYYTDIMPPQRAKEERREGNHPPPKKHHDFETGVARVLGKWEAGFASFSFVFRSIICFSLYLWSFLLLPGIYLPEPSLLPREGFCRFLPGIFGGRGIMFVYRDIVCCSS